LDVKQILEKYGTHLEKTVTHKRAMIAIKNLAPLYKCTTRTLSKCIDLYIIGRNVSPGTINRELSVLQAALRWSFKRGDIDFVPSLSRLPSPLPRSQFLNEAQIKLLLESCRGYPHVETFVRIALMTGQRLEAILSLKWDQVDFETGLVDFHDPEMPLAHRRKGRGIVPMSEGLRSLLTSLDQDCPYVIHKGGKRVRDFRVAWKTIMERSGLSITPHILRHTVATQLAQKNVPMPQISRLLGHRSTAITERVYAKYSPEFCREAVSNLNYFV
jgi:integrase